MTAFWLLLALAAAPQEGTLDLLDGETLYDGGWLLNLGYQYQRESTLLRGGDEVADPMRRSQTGHELQVSAHYGLRHDLQLSVVLPYEFRELEGAGGRLAASGPGDLAAFAKWRFHRWDAPHKALNLAVLGALETPTGADDERDGGVLVPPEIQPGSGSWDPMLGAAATYEPYRWRFNAALLYKANGENGADYAFGDEVFAELAAGNRFWLEPYPGPFMRADLLLRYRWAARDEQFGAGVGATGGERVTVGLNWAFRPRPSLDIQAGVELPVYERVNETQLAPDFTGFVNLGLRF